MTENILEDFYDAKVFPDLKKALVKLTDQILKSDEVRKHKDRLKELQVLDKIEQKNIEKEKLKLELGSDYDSSSNSSILEELEFKKSESQNSDPEISSFSEVAPSILSVKNSSDLSKDNEIEKPQKRKIDKEEKKRMTQLLIKKKEEKLFNPLKYLGLMLKEMNQRNLEGDNLFPSKQKKKTVKIIEEPVPIIENENYVEEDVFSP